MVAETASVAAWGSLADARVNTAITSRASVSVTANAYFFFEPDNKGSSSPGLHPAYTNWTNESAAYGKETSYIK
jgi:hypothetical protein